MDFILMRTKRSGIRVLLLLAYFFLGSAVAYAQSVKCDTYSNTTNSQDAFDFSRLPSQIPTNVPVGTTIFDTTMNLELWCAKTVANLIGPRKIYISREPIVNALGSKSGLSFYITINGDRSDERKSYDTGIMTDAVFLQGLNPSNYTKVNIPVRVELVKTGENISFSKLNNYIFLFSVGDEGRGDLLYRAINTDKLSFSSFTCNIATNNIHRILPSLQIASINGTGRIEDHVSDFFVTLNCNGDLWSTLSINMAFDGTTVPGLEKAGVYQFMTPANSVAQGIGFQLLHQNAAGDYLESGNGDWFTVANFASQLKVIDVPIRAAYYRTAGEVTPGKLKGIVTFTIDYQ